MSDRRPGAEGVELSVEVGSLRLSGPVMTASGTSGHGAELAAYMDLSRLGAVVVKSLSADPWPGNPPPRLRPTTAGMLNSVGLQGPGLSHWIEEELPSLAATGAAVVVSIWGRHVEDYARAAELVGGCGEEVVAVEVNLSCPNLDGGSHLFAHDPVTAAEVVSATAACGRPRWAKLSANTDRLVEVAAAVSDAGAEAVTLINTLLGMVIDIEARRPALGGGGGGLSGPAIHPVAVRSVYEVHRALPGLPIVGVGGVGCAEDAVELLMAGASAVQVGTASFADPAMAEKVQVGLGDWCKHHGIAAVCELKGSAHG
jgi:dihydroorotate dehydrogenase (NAD+) catalytic subunit